MFFVDYYNDIVGPNGIDPAGLVSSTASANAGSSLGNYRTDAPGMVYFHDGLHPGPAAAYAMGKKLAEVIIAAGVPAKEVGKLVAERASAAGVTQVIFDRSGYIYHGRVKALAEAAREAGLKF